MAEVKNVAKIIGEVGFKINSKAWANLGKFQKSLIETKKMMQGLSTDLKINVGGSRGMSQVQRVAQRFEKSKRMGIRRDSVTPAGGPSSAELRSLKDYYQKLESKKLDYQADAHIKSRQDYLKSQQKEEKIRQDAARKQALTIGDASAQVKARERFLKQQQRAKVTSGVRTDRFRDIAGGFLSQGKIGREQMAQYLVEVRALNRQFRKGSMEAQQYSEAMRQVTARARNAARQHKTLFERISSVRGLMMSGAVLGGGMVLGNVMRTGQEFEGLEASMIKASGSLQAARQDMQWVSDQAMRMGVDVGFAADGFVKLAVAGKEVIGLKNVKDLFVGYSEFATSVGVSKFRYEKGLAALGQMLN